MAKDNTTDLTEKKLRNLKPFKKGDPRINREGRPKGSGISITTEIKKKLAEIPDGQKATYLELLINRIFKQAIQDGDQQMIKNIWNYVDGLPEVKGQIDSNVIVRIDQELQLQDGNTKALQSSQEPENDS